MYVNAVKHSFSRAVLLQTTIKAYKRTFPLESLWWRHVRFNILLRFRSRSSNLFSHWSISLNGRTVVIRGLMVADDGGNGLEGVTISRARRFPPQGFIIDRNIYTCSKFVGNSILRGLSYLISLLTSTASSSKLSPHRKPIWKRFVTLFGIATSSCSDITWWTVIDGTFFVASNFWCDMTSYTQ